MSPMQPVKLVVAGPVGAGKTTFVQTLSETEVIETDELASEEIGKPKTTVGLDFGTFDLDGIPVYLFGTPGQDRFDFVWEVVSAGALGLIILVAGDRPQDLPHARVILEAITSWIPVPFVVGVTRQDLPRVWDADDVADYLSLDLSQVTGVNATQFQDSIHVVELLLQLIQDRMSEVHRMEAPMA